RIPDRLGIAMATPPARWRNCRRFMGCGAIACASSRATFDPPFNAMQVEVPQPGSVAQGTVRAIGSLAHRYVTISAFFRDARDRARRRDVHGGRVRPEVQPARTWAQFVGLVTYQVSHPVVMFGRGCCRSARRRKTLAMDLRAPPRAAIRRILLPLLYPASFAIAFTVSLDFVAVGYLSDPP